MSSPLGIRPSPYILTYHPYRGRRKPVLQLELTVGGGGQGQAVDIPH